MQTKTQTDFTECLTPSSLGKCNDAKPALQLQLKKSTHLHEFKQIFYSQDSFRTKHFAKTNRNSVAK